MACPFASPAPSSAPPRAHVLSVLPHMHTPRTPQQQQLTSPTPPAATDQQPQQPQMQPQPPVATAAVAASWLDDDTGARVASHTMQSYVERLVRLRVAHKAPAAAAGHDAVAAPPAAAAAAAAAPPLSSCATWPAQFLSPLQQAHHAFLSGRSSWAVFNILLDRVLDITQSEYGFIGRLGPHPERAGCEALTMLAVTNIAWTPELEQVVRPQHLSFVLDHRSLVRVTLEPYAWDPVTCIRPRPASDTFYTNDCARHPNSAGVPKAHPPLDTYAAVNLYVGSELMGVMGLANRRSVQDGEIGYRSDHLPLLQQLGTSIAGLVHMYELSKLQQQQQQQPLASGLGTGRILTPHLTPEGVVRSIPSSDALTPPASVPASTGVRLSEVAAAGGVFSTDSSGQGAPASLAPDQLIPEEVNHSIVDSIAQGVIVCDDHFSILQINKGCKRMMRFGGRGVLPLREGVAAAASDPPTVLHQPLSALLPDLFAQLAMKAAASHPLVSLPASSGSDVSTAGFLLPSVQAPQLSTLAPASYAHPLETVLRCADGTSLSVSVLLSPFYFHARQMVACIVTDNSESQRHQQERDAFLSFLSHELRNPLHNISASVDFLLEQEEEERVRQQRTAAAAVMDEDARRNTHASSHDSDSTSGGASSSGSGIVSPTCSQERRELLSGIHDSATLMRALVDDVLHLSKLSSGKAEAERCVFDLSALLSGMIRAHRRACEAKGVRLLLRTDGDMGGDLLRTHRFVGDPNKIKQILTNLLNNATKFTHRGEIVLRVSCQGLVSSPKAGGPHVPSHSRLGSADAAPSVPSVSASASVQTSSALAAALQSHLSLQQQTSLTSRSPSPALLSPERVGPVESASALSPDQPHSQRSARPSPSLPRSVSVRFRVVDTGCGIDADAMCHLFQPYRQAKAYIARIYGGTGLGLSIVARLVRLLGGDVVVRSVVGQGTEFDVLLPLPCMSIAEADVQAALLRPAGEGGAGADDMDGWGDVSGSVSVSSTASSTRSLEDACDRDRDRDLGHATRATSLPDAAEAPWFTSTGSSSPPPSSLVVAGAAVSSAPSSSEPSESAAAGPLRLLFVDDVAANCKIGLRMLQQIGVRCPIDVAHNGRIACDMVQAAPATGNQTTTVGGAENGAVAGAGVGAGGLPSPAGPSAAAFPSSSSSSSSSPPFSPHALLLLDIQMPEMSGLAACRRLRSLGYRMPIVALTGNVLAADRDECLRAGFSDLIPKPFDRTQLRAIIRTYAPALLPRDTH